MLVFIEIVIKIGSQMNMLERKKLKSRNHGVPVSRFFLVRYRYLSSYQKWNLLSIFILYKFSLTFKQH